MLYRATDTPARLRAHASDFWLLAVMVAVVPYYLPLMRRIRLERPKPPAATAAERAAGSAVEKGAV
jgi:hypothetical protein